MQKRILGKRKSMVDPRDLLVIRELVKVGFEPQEICKRLRISQATYYRRMAELDRVKTEATKHLRAEA